MCSGAPLRRQLEAFADLDALDRLRAHQRRGQASIEPVVFSRVRSETRRDAAGANLDEAADRVPICPRFVHALLEIGGDHVPRDSDTDLGEQSLRHRASCDDHGGVARACPLEHIADVRQAILHDAGQIGMSGPWQRHLFRSLA